jgi:hypothetical protein
MVILRSAMHQHNEFVIVSNLVLLFSNSKKRQVDHRCDDYIGV